MTNEIPAPAIGARVRIIAPDPGVHGAIGRVVGVTPEWEHSLTLEYEDRAGSRSYYRPDEVEPLGAGAR